MTQVSYKVELRSLPARHAAVVTFTARSEEMSSKMPQAFGTVMASLGKRGLYPEGPAVGRYIQLGDAFQVEAGFYIAEHIDSDDGVTCIELPAGDVLVTTHIGPYEALTTAYEAVQSYARDHDLKLAKWMWEEYWSDPSTPAAEWRTEVIWPIKA